MTCISAYTTTTQWRRSSLLRPTKVCFAKSLSLLSSVKSHFCNPLSLFCFTDYIRSLAIHPTQPYILSSSDDMLIKLWDWEKNWQCSQIFEGHTHYVMQLAFNPKDPNTFASASLDRTIKVHTTCNCMYTFIYFYSVLLPT